MSLPAHRPGTVGTVKLKHPSGSAVRTHSVLHRLILFHRGLGKLLTENKGIGEFRRCGLQHFVDDLLAETIGFQTVVGKPMTASAIPSWDSQAP